VSGGEWLPHRATIADLAHHEVWLSVEESPVELPDPGCTVRLVLRRSDGGTRTAETTVLRHIGSDGPIVVLQRPTAWDPPSRRAHSRAWLAIPAYLRPDGGPTVSVETTNVGIGGFHCLSDVPVSLGQELSVSLMLTPVQSFDCRAEVVRLQNNADGPAGRQVVLALRFVQLTEDEQASLASSLVALADDVDADSVPLAWRNAKSTQTDS